MHWTWDDAVDHIYRFGEVSGEPPGQDVWDDVTTFVKDPYDLLAVLYVFRYLGHFHAAHGGLPTESEVRMVAECLLTTFEELEHAAKYRTVSGASDDGEMVVRI